MPPFSTEHSIAQVTCRSEPKAAPASSSIAPAFRRPGAPFFLRPENAIIIFNLMTHDRFGFHECLTLITHQAALLAYLPLRSTDPEDDMPPLSVPWSVWGPNACRWLETSFSASRWITTTCGQRYVTIEEELTDDERPHCHVLVYDFNPYNVRRLVQKYQPTPGEVKDIAVQRGSSPRSERVPTPRSSHHAESSAEGAKGGVTYVDVGIQVDLPNEGAGSSVWTEPKEMTTFVDPEKPK